MAWAHLHLFQLWQEISEESGHVQDIMSTLDNFQLGEGPAKPGNHDDGDVRPIQVDLRYKHLSCDGSENQTWSDAGPRPGLG